MIVEKKSRPVVRHNPYKETMNGVRNIISEFEKELVLQSEKLIREGRIRKEHLFRSGNQAETLAAVRQKLVLTIRRGMLERQDLEAEIGVFVTLVWFGRLSKEKQDKIIAEWG